MSRLQEASYRIDDARAKPPTLESLRAWLEALTAYATAQTEIHQCNDESIHEKLHELARRCLASAG